MQVDKITLQDIGLFDSDDTIGIASHLNFCKTNGGSEQFHQHLSNPLPNLESITERQQTLKLFLQHLSFLEEMKITNGTTLVVEKFFETNFNSIPVQISIIGAYWYKFFNKSDYSLIEYSIEHLSLFYQNLMNWLEIFEPHQGNRYIDHLTNRIKKITQHPTLDSLRKGEKIKQPQEVLTLGHFFINHFKNNTRILLECFYEIDAYYSMASAIQKNHFVFPEWVHNGHPLLEVQEAIHPLLTKPVHNSISLTYDGNLVFLTGANMAGKSTFIKTIGIVLYLSHIGMGAPAKKITLGFFDGLITNLTIADNVIKGESYFYNEVIRIKNTVEKINDGKHYFVLIDELFKGTNIQDAMKCSIKVIEGLQKLRSSLFIISTHLYEISDSLKIYPNIQFYYFETDVDNQQLNFHYQLKTGVSKDRIGYLILEREGVVRLLNELGK